MTPLALLDLAWHAALVHPWKRLLQRGPALARFEAAYAGDALRPTSLAEGVTRRAAARCTGCGLCDDGRPISPEPALAALGRPAAFRLAGRRSADASLEAPLLAALALAGSPAHRCPAGLSIGAVVEALRSPPVAPAPSPG